MSEAVAFLKQALGIKELSDLEQAADDIRRLCAHPGYRHLLRIKLAYETDIAMVGIRDKTEPREYHVGRQQGLREFFVIVDNIMPAVQQALADAERVRKTRRSGMGAPTGSMSDDDGLSVD